MTKSELIDRATRIIDESTTGDEDWIIAPTKHAGLYAESAPALAKVLGGSGVAATCKQYEDSDKDAGTAQDRFKQTARRANLAVLGTASSGALILVVNALSAGAQSAVLAILGAVSVVAGGLGTLWIRRIDGGKYLQKWMTARARAETHRLRLFDLATAAPPDGEPECEPSLALLQLEYFRRYELDVQVAYYRSARERHAAAAQRTLVLGSWAVLLAATATGVSGILASWKSDFANIAALGVMSAALSSYVSRKGEISQDARNADRYERTGDALLELSKELDQVRLAVAGGARGPLQKFVAAVHEHLSVEHRQWLKGAESTEGALKQLREEIAKAQGVQGKD